MRYSVFARLLPRLMMLAAVFLLPACTYFDTGEEVNVSNAEAIDLMNQDIEAEQIAEPAPMLSTSEIFRDNADGRVEIYGLDGPAVSPAERAPEDMVFEQNNNQNFNSDPSVEIYPLDGGFEPQYGRISPPALTPMPAASRPAMVEEVDLEDSASYGEGKSDGTAYIYFDHGSSDLDGGDLEIIADIARGFDPSLGNGIDVVGNASVDSPIDDPVRRKIANLKISMNRAFNVASALMNRGIPAEALRVTGWGEVRPPRQTNGLDPEAAARRVEIVLQ